LPENVIEKIIRLRDTICTDEKIKWEPREKYHVTIKFIGDVSNEMVEKISDELLLLNQYPGIKCSFNKFGFFSRDNKPAILWAGIKADVGLFKIIKDLNEKLNKFSIPIENRKFNPHITILRIKNDPGNNFVNNFKNFTFDPILFTANSVTLFKSILHSERSKYFEIKNYKLKELE
jgi:2'-5' RNA ligase